MSSASWPPYPPCASGTCTDAICCGLGRKFRWPELMGKKAGQAKAVIERENPFVKVVILEQGRVGTLDFCCNRVWLRVANNGDVIGAPIVG